MNILVLDGGMGTTLEAAGHDVSGAMWGSELVERDPDAIARVHRDYARVADLVETATYQMTTAALETAGHTPASASRVLCSAVALAADACAASTSTSNSTSTSTHTPQVVLSLGPYGATLSPGQEYAGIYPAPFDTESALTKWHLSRLRTYAPSHEWSRVAWLAFETIPLLAEVRAIRRALGQLYAEGVERKPFWITSAYPGGRGPRGDRGEREASTSASGDGEDGRAPIPAIVEALVGKLDAAEMPDAIGVNCTNPAYISDIVRDLGAALPTGVSPRLVLYPDGGAVYDTVSRTWTGGKTEPDAWAAAVLGVVREALAQTRAKGGAVWDGAIVGGCCKTGVDEIVALRRLVDAERGRGA